MMKQPLPRRLSTDRGSPFYDPCYARVGILFDGKKRTDVHEYDIDAGYIVIRARNDNGQFKIDHERGEFVLERLHGVVEPYWAKEAPALVHSAEESQEQQDARIEAAADKRARKAARRLALAERSASR